ncbi:MAG: exo-alpha-sialidase [Mucilaginibacter sp.]
MRMLKYLYCFLVLIISVKSNHAQSLIRNNYTTPEGLPHLKTERVMLYAPENEWLYAHHPSIAAFKGKLVAIWSNGYKDEDSPGQRVLFSVAKNFHQWSVPAMLARPGKVRDTANVLTAAGLYVHHDTLVAYYGEYEKHRTNTHLWARYSLDAVHWSEPIDLHLPLIPNHGPEALKSGRLIISGNFSFPYTDDPSGLSGWKMSSFYPPGLYTQDNSATFYAPAEKLGLPPLCEGSFYQTDDGVVHMLLRVTGKGWKGKLWLTESSDNGSSWSKPIETTFSDNDSKFHFGRLPDQRFYYAGIPDTLHHYDRTPLVLALAKDGAYFNHQYIIADEPYALKKPGLWKGGQYGYPHTLIVDGWFYVIVSRQKEAIEVLRFKLDQLK